MDLDRINALREMYIKELIPNWHLYDAKTSLYDIAATTFQPLMLREHFRCVPDIIGYSNKLSYDFKIKPLRDASTCSVTPPLIQFRVNDGQRDGKRKVNPKEAETIVSLMMACIEQNEYDGMTFGVISLLGDEQAQLIQEIILEKIDPSIIKSRCILCGNASHFQGDERDIVFLSIVDSNEGDGPLTMAGEGTDQSRKQRYNVAVSRAKDQIWVVHSLDYTKDLKSGDLRRDHGIC
jgi:superfamily I DNA and/or RNA helicase